MNLSVQLLTPNKFSRPGIKMQKVKGVAWHYVGNPGTSAQNNRNYFESLKSQKGSTYVSSHYVVGLKGEIIQCIPETEWSYCTTAANGYTISIECCHPDSTGKFTPTTEQALVELTADICKRHGLNPETAILRHYDVTKKRCPLYYVTHPEAFAAAKRRVSGILEGNRKTGWIEQSGRWWYRHEDGSYTKAGWERVKNDWYYFDPQGWMVTGWVSHKGSWYFCGENGAMVTGWHKEPDGRWYYLNPPNGDAAKGMKAIGGKVYHFAEEKTALYKECQMMEAMSG